MKKKAMSLNKVIQEIENMPDVRRLPKELKAFIRERLKTMTRVEFPVVTFKDNGWVVAHTPVIDVSAQGRTEEEAIKNLKAMIEDYMTDPDTQKPKIRSMMKMEVGIKTVPMKIPITIGGENVGENTPITQRQC